MGPDARRRHRRDRGPGAPRRSRERLRARSRRCHPYVAGDTRYYDELVDVATVFPALDVAVLPVGGLRLLGFPREMGPGDAARAAAVLGARRLIPMGYGEEGGFPLRWHALRPVERFVKACAERGIDRQRIVVLEPGESWHYYK